MICSARQESGRRATGSDSGLKALAVFGAVLLLGLSLRLTYVVARPGISHDEANTLIFSTCNWSRYQEMIDARQAPVSAKARASEWRKFMESDGRLCTRTIFDDVTRTDVHPPLFPEVLHLWVLLTGTSLFATRLLNVLIDVLSALMFFLLARDLLGRDYALIAMTFYAVAPAYLLISGEIRSYALLGLCNVVAVWASVRIMRGPGAWRWWAVFGLAGVSGLYTHYLFSIVFLPLTLFLLLVCLGRDDRPQTLRALLVLFAVGVLLLPLAQVIWQHQIDAVVEIGWSGPWVEHKNPFAAMAWIFFDTLFGTFRGMIFALPSGLNLIFVGLIIGISAYGLAGARSREEGWLLLLLLSVTSIGHAVLYALGALPPDAIGAKYQVTAVPYFLLGVVYVLARFNRRWLTIVGTVGLAGIMLAASTRITVKAFAAGSTTMSAVTVAGQVPRASLVILDSVVTGIVGPAVISWPPQQRMLIADQNDLARDGDLARRIRGEESVAYVSNLKYQNTEVGRRQILSRLRQGFGLVPSDDRLDPLVSLGCAGCGKGYQIFIFRGQGNAERSVHR